MNLIKNPHFLISVFASLLFIPFLGNVHLFDWDEINFAEAAREMIVSGNYKNITIDFEPFWEKPPLFIWFQVTCMKIFGINEFAARLPNAICGIFTLNLIYYLGNKLYNSKLALWWVLLYAGSFTPHFYFKSGIIDPWFNLFIFLAIIQLFYASQKEKSREFNFILCGIFLGLALLTKGPVAIIITGLSGFVFLIIKKFKFFFGLKDLLLLLVSIAILPLLWFLPDWLNGDFWFTTEFLKYQADLFLNPVASHGQPWFYHPLVLIFGCFPAVIISIPYFVKRNEKSSFLTWMQILFWVTLILFSTVTTKIVHYSSLCYIPATFIGAYFLSKKNRIFLWQNLLILIVGIIFSLAFAIIAGIGISSKFRGFVLPLVKDEFAVQNILTPTNWEGFEIVFSLIFLVISVFSFAINIKDRSGKGLRIWLVSNSIFLFLYLIAVIPKVENHVQGSIINFYKTLQGKDVYVETMGFKSYAHYFYTAKKQLREKDILQLKIKEFCQNNNLGNIKKPDEISRNAINSFRQTLLLTQLVNKPVYFVCKTGNSEALDTAKSFKIIMNQGGYRVYKRD